MKSMFLALTLPVLFTGCAAYVGETGPGYPGYYDGSSYAYDGGPTYVGFSTYNRGYYSHGYHGYQHTSGGYHGASVASRGSSHIGGAHVASTGRVGGGHASGGGGASHSASASAGGEGGHR